MSVLVPAVDMPRCRLCGACGKACRYSAIVALPNTVLTFPKLCHGCGGCLRCCPEGAIREVARVTGVVEEGVSGEVAFMRGTLNIGEAMAPPGIRAVLEAAPADRTIVIDSPPGTSCPVIASITGAHMALIVTEPTLSGLHDLERVSELSRQFNLKTGVCTNRADINPAMADRIEAASAARGVPVLGRIRYDDAVTAAQIRRMAVVENGDGPAARDIRALWARVRHELA